MIPALILFALGLADWLTTRAIIAHGGYEQNPVARFGIAKLGFTPFFVGKAVALGGVGYLAAGIPWIWGPVAVILGAVVVSNLLVLRRM